MRPDWHCCETCYFTLEDDDTYFWCHFDTEPIGTTENNFCSRWTCHSCCGSWDDGEEHSNCMDIQVELDFG
jgi:hypothetical protein